MPSSLFEIERNDPAACQRYHDERGGVTLEELSIMRKLQDRGDALDDLAKNWIIRES